MSAKEEHNEMNERKKRRGGWRLRCMGWMWIEKNNEKIPRKEKIWKWKEKMESRCFVWGLGDLVWDGSNEIRWNRVANGRPDSVLGVLI